MLVQTEQQRNSNNLTALQPLLQFRCFSVLLICYLKIPVVQNVLIIPLPYFYIFK